MTETDIKRIVKDCRDAGYEIRMKDIIFLMACRFIEDAGIVYRSVFDRTVPETELKEYESGISYLKRNLDAELNAEGAGTDGGKDGSRVRKAKKSKYKDITFEENKEALIKLLEEIKAKRGTEDLDIATALKLETDIRTKLNDKFDITEKKDEHRIIVNSKYNDICPYCRREVRIKTDEDMIREIKEKYILTPKNQ